MEQSKPVVFHENEVGNGVARCECGGTTWEITGDWMEKLGSPRCRVTSKCLTCFKKYTVAYACPAGDSRPVTCNPDRECAMFSVAFNWIGRRV